eukprot:TRINITY_DN7067_c0_g1_i1.p1 TRINITY_DN7067_c0_g1~~TRINITY_DN7067_c0_g1_i1.p1  ORF type:complete len:406 (+),score=64.86 TRINITY_DN7067_c0_g1_i1:126-1343(+)
MLHLILGRGAVNGAALMLILVCCAVIMVEFSVASMSSSCCLDSNFSAKIKIEALRPFGAKVLGIDLSVALEDCMKVQLEEELARRGFLVFPNQHALAVSDLIEIASYFGGQEVIGRHVVHPEALHEDVLRLSNKVEYGVQGVGPQWHNDGATERSVFSHVIFHVKSMPPEGGGIEIADLAAAFKSLPDHLKEKWRNLASVNAYSGVLHPLVYPHPISKSEVLFLHLGQTGAVVQWSEKNCSGSSKSGSSTATVTANDANKPWPYDKHRWSSMKAMTPGLRAADLGCSRSLNEKDVIELMAAFNERLNDLDNQLIYQHRPGDLVILDNLAVSHRATASAHDANNGLRIVDRITVAGAVDLDLPSASGLPPFLYIFGDNPFNDGGVWQESDYFGVGFRWDSNATMRN